MGSFTAATIPWKLAATPLAKGGSAPVLGQHGHEILSGRLGLGEDEIGDLVSSGAVALGRAGV